MKKTTTSASGASIQRQADAKRPKMTPEEQRAAFVSVGREHGADGDEEEFKGVLRKLTAAKPPLGKR